MNEQIDGRTDGQAIKHTKRTVKMNEWVYDEWGFRLHLFIYAKLSQENMGMVR